MQFIAEWSPMWWLYVWKLGLLRNRTTCISSIQKKEEEEHPDHVALISFSDQRAEERVHAWLPFLLSLFGYRGKAWLWGPLARGGVWKWEYPAPLPRASPEVTD